MSPNYHSVPHIRPPFFNLSASRKRGGGGGLYAGSDILPREYAPTSGAMPRCSQTDTEAGSTCSYTGLSHPPETQILFGQDRLREVGHSVDTAFSKHSPGLSVQCAVALA